ncbi:hypothetical protein OSTOST_06099, partial [Ostertagia ostertagi]
MSLTEIEENGNGSPSLTSKAESVKKSTERVPVTEKLTISHENVSSASSMDTTSTSTSPTSSGPTGETNSTNTTSRMENGEPLPRLAPGLYHKKPAPILTDSARPFSS